MQIDQAKWQLLLKKKKNVYVYVYTYLFYFFDTKIHCTDGNTICSFIQFVTLLGVLRI